MGDRWLDIRGPRGVWRAELAPGLTRVGGQGCEVVLEGVDDSELHLWDAPPKLVHSGSGPQPEVDGRPRDECDLVPGTRVRWRDHELVYGSAGPRAPLEEIPLSEVLPPAPAASTAPQGSASRAWNLVRAGMLADLGLADRLAVKRWQEAVLRNEFDPDAAARDLTQGAPAGEDDPRLVERGARLLRDFLMSSFQRGVQGAGRRARNAARSGLAMIIAQGVAIGVYTLVLFVIALLSRVKWGFSVDRLLDVVVGR